MSFKAQMMQQLVRTHRPDVHWCCPQLPPSPKQAAELILDLTQGWNSTSSAVIGSSLGGFYANWLARSKHFKSVLINPACQPARDLARYIGEHTTWQNPQESFFFRAEFIGELLELYPAPHLSTVDLNQQNHAHEDQKNKELKNQAPSHSKGTAQLLMACTGDEVLNYTEMITTYSSATVYTVQGSDHAMSDFEDHVQVVLDFLFKAAN
jgi:predicted esterase YcpF (UPF0227 family)